MLQLKCVFKASIKAMCVSICDQVKTWLSSVRSVFSSLSYSLFTLSEPTIHSDTPSGSVDVVSLCVYMCFTCMCSCVCASVFVCWLAVNDEQMVGESR